MHQLALAVSKLGFKFRGEGQRVEISKSFWPGLGIGKLLVIRVGVESILLRLFNIELENKRPDSDL